MADVAPQGYCIILVAFFCGRVTKETQWIHLDSTYTFEDGIPDFDLYYYIRYRYFFSLSPPVDNDWHVL